MMKVVILGGGFCGAFIAKKLDRHTEHDIILIDKKTYFEYSPALCTLLLNPSYHKRSIIPFATFLKHTRIITEPAICVTPHSVELENETLSFDYLVLSTGITYPIILQDTTQVVTVKSGMEVVQHALKVAQATSILIIGGGLIGTEVAGELATYIPRKQILLIQPYDRLLERNTKNVSRYAKKYLQNKGVQIIFGEKIIDHAQGVFITQTQRRIKADIGIWCGGIKSDPSYMKMFSPSIFTAQKTLRVNQYLQLEGYPNIFVGGDLTDIAEEKTAANAEQHAAVISENILRAQRKKPLFSYIPRKRPVIISLGKWDGILTYLPIMLPGFIPAIIKRFVEKFSLLRLR